MQKLDNVYVIDELANIGKYAGISEAFAKAVKFIGETDLDSLKPGRTAIDGDAVYVNSDQPMLVALSDRQAEVHRFHFDIHVNLVEDEIIGISVYDGKTPGCYDEKADTGFYDYPIEPVTLKRGQFLITWPNTCAHAPACTAAEPHPSRKLVFKVLQA